MRFLYRDAYRPFSVETYYDEEKRIVRKAFLKVSSDMYYWLE